MKIKNRLLYLCTVALTSIALVSCEKEMTNGYMPERPIVGFEPGNRPPGYLRYYSEEAKLRDTVYLRTYEFYLWQDQLPTSFYTQDYKTADGLLEALKAYAKDPHGNPYDRFSFLDRWGAVDSEIQQGQNQGGFGFDVRYQTEEALYLKKVDIGSPAYQAGLRRGWQVLAINGRTDLSLAAMEQDDFNFLFNAVYGQSIEMRLRKPDGGEVTVSLHSTPFGLTPIIAHRIFDVSGDKVGYLAFDFFVNEDLIKNQINTIFNEFEGAGVNKLIMDLRYNGGGNVSTAEYFSNLLAPGAAHQRRMFYYKINEHFAQSWGALLFQPVAFNKQNTLELDRVYFLVTASTASASELLINNLTPYMDVKVIGDGNTYGKPVGYFGWPIMGVDLYAVSFQTFNDLGQGDYFNGIPVDQYAKDDVTRDFGDPAEAMTAEALYHVAHGNFSGTVAPAATGTGGATGSMSAVGRSAGRIGKGGLAQQPSFNSGLDAKLRRPIHGAMFDFRKINLTLAD